MDDEDDDSQVSLQRSIDSLTLDITQLVRASESKLKELIKFQDDSSRCDDQSKDHLVLHSLINSKEEYTESNGTALARYHLQA